MAEPEGTGDGARLLISAVQASDADQAGRLLSAGADVSARDDDGWNALDWAAGKGDPAVIGLLLRHGGDATAAGRDRRLPHEIAMAAGHLDAARTLREARDRSDPGGPGDYAWRPYCRAYTLEELQRYPGWPAGADPAALAAGTDGAADEAGEPGEAVAYLHDDLTVTASMFPGEDVLFDDVTPEWAQFCAAQLNFKVPDELDLATTGPYAPDNPADQG